MKKAKVVLVVLILALAVLSASCNRKLCPAYTKAETMQDHRG